MKYIFVLLALFAPISIAIANPVVDKSVEYYDVKGWDAAFIHNEMDAKGPYDRNSGDRVWAHTSWNVRWDYEYAKESISCKISGVQTRVTVKFIVPNWVDREKAPKSVQDKWDTFYTNLRRHEQTHAMHGVTAAREIEAMAVSLPAKRTCDQAKEQANEQASAIIKKYSDKDIAYDNKTDNGRTEGLVF